MMLAASEPFNFTNPSEIRRRLLSRKHHDISYHAMSSYLAIDIDTTRFNQLELQKLRITLLQQGYRTGGLIGGSRIRYIASKNRQEAYAVLLPSVLRSKPSCLKPAFVQLYLENSGIVSVPEPTLASPKPHKTTTTAPSLKPKKTSKNASTRGRRRTRSQEELRSIFDEAGVKQQERISLFSGNLLFLRTDSSNLGTVMSESRHHFRGYLRRRSTDQRNGIIIDPTSVSRMKAVAECPYDALGDIDSLDTQTVLSAIWNRLVGGIGTGERKIQLVQANFRAVLAIPIPTDMNKAALHKLRDIFNNRNLKTSRIPEVGTFIVWLDEPMRALPDTPEAMGTFLQKLRLGPDRVHSGAAEAVGPAAGSAGGTGASAAGHGGDITVDSVVGSNIGPNMVFGSAAALAWYDAAMGEGSLGITATPGTTM